METKPILVRPVNVSCRCGATTYPRQNTVKQNGKMITEATWSCGRCGSFVKRGTVSIVDAPE